MLPGKTYTPDDYLRIIWRRRWLIAIPAVMIVSMTAVYSMFLPNRYRASTNILIIPQQVPESIVRPTINAGLAERLNIMRETILSRTRLEQIILELKLYRSEREEEGMIMEDVVERMRRDIFVIIPRSGRRRGGPESFTVAYQSTEPRTAMRVTEKLAGLFVTENRATRALLADSTDTFLKGQLDDALRRLTEKERLLQEFREKNRGKLPDQIQNNLSLLQVDQSRLLSITESNNRDRDRYAVLDKMLAELPAASTSPMPAPPPARRNGNGGAPGVGTSAAAQLDAARAELHALELRLKPEHPDVGRAKRIIAELEAKAEAEALQQPLSSVTSAVTSPAAERAALERADQIRREMQDIRQRFEIQKREAARLQESIATLNGQVQETPGIQAELTALMRDYAAIKESYESLLRKSEESKIAVQLENREIGQQFKLIDSARMPERPFSPDRFRINLFGILGGVAFGLALVAFLEYRDTSFKSDEDIMTTLALPVLAVIPLMTNAVERRAQRRRRYVLAASASLACMLLAAAVVLFMKYRPDVAKLFQ
jgi:polysaccharide chain length determinant protein (PEP-CTERM system associated)